MYAHEKLSDFAAEQCFNEMYPKGKHVEIQESDEPCIIFCVLKKIGIMDTNGSVNSDILKRRLQVANQLDQHNNRISEVGNNCIQTLENTQHKADVCKRAKVFNDCTHLYKILH